MQIKGIIIGLIITAIGLTAFGFVNRETEVKTNNETQKEVSVDQDVVDIKYLGLPSFEINRMPVNVDISYFVSPGYKLSTTKEKLEKAKLISDLIPDYPSNWVNDYTSVEIVTTCAGKEKKAMNSNDVLNMEQINILNTSDQAAKILINIKYKTANPITGAKEHREMNLSMAVVPEVEAEYIGGYDEMIAYLKDNSFDKISSKKLQPFPQSLVQFTINEEGKAENIKLTEASGDTEIDKLIIELNKEMPQWKPAANAKGEPVKQGFEFSVGPPNC
jgi:hypothetical protein